MAYIQVNLGYGRKALIEADCFTRILKDVIYDTEELREDTPISVISSYSYKGVAPDGTPTSSAAWCIVRTSYDSNGLMSRMQYREDVVWDNRVSGWA